MKRILTALLTLGLALAMTAAAPAAGVEIRQQDGATWRGDLDDQVSVTYLSQGVEITLEGKLLKAARLYIVVEGAVAGELRNETIFRADIVQMADLKELTKKVTTSRKQEALEAAANAPVDIDGKQLGVFLLPLEGPVGEELRHQEILEIGKHADKFGPGQTIILVIKSNGGLVIEALDIENAIDEIKKRHRVVAWIEKAISAGCSTAMACDEIYFMTEGSAGSVTTLAGSGSLTGAEAEKHVEDFVRLAKKNGYSEHIARSMKLNKYECSYDKDPVTGEVTFYGDTSGEFLLSDKDSNLSFNAPGALKCGFSKGTADTTRELAEMLDLPRWHEIDTYGREIAKDWQDTVGRARKEVPLLIARLEYEGSSGGTIEFIGRRIKNLGKLRRWVLKLGRTGWGLGLPDVPDQIDKEIENLRKQLRMLQRRRG